jgi:hypothetical protein
MLQGLTKGRFGLKIRVSFPPSMDHVLVALSSPRKGGDYNYTTTKRYDIYQNMRYLPLVKCCNQRYLCKSEDLELFFQSVALPTELPALNHITLHPNGQDGKKI